jgi:shikimate dehydrogenase
MDDSPIMTGKTRIVPIIGHPIAQVRTPGPMNQWFAKQGIDAAIVPMDIRPERVSSFFAVLKVMENCVGCSITMPHKQAAFIASDEVTERARRAKSVNTIRRSTSGKLIGDMTDGIAMVEALEKNEIRLADQNALIVGAGGAGTAIAFELADKGVASLVILEIDQMRRRALAGELSRLFPDVAVFDHVPAGMKIKIAINASPMGMNSNDPLPFPVDQLSDALIVADAVTKPKVTPWLEEAATQGLKTQMGEEMALAQVSIQLRYLKLMPPPMEMTKKSQTSEHRNISQGVTR